MTHQPELGIENPYALDEEQFQAAVDLLKEQRPHISEYWSDYLKEIQAFETTDSVAGTTWQVIQNVLAGSRARRPTSCCPKRVRPDGRTRG